MLSKNGRIFDVVLRVIMLPIAAAKVVYTPSIPNLVSSSIMVSGVIMLLPLLQLIGMSKRDLGGGVVV